MVGECETGNETYVANLLAALAASGEDLEILAAVTDRQAFEDRVGVHDRLALYEVSASPFKRLGMDLPRLAVQQGVDLVHVTYIGPVSLPCPLVVSIHDVSFRQYPEWFSLRDKCVLRIGVALSVRRAGRVLTISEHANEEIRRVYGLSADKVVTTYLAADLQYEAVQSIGDWEGFSRHGIKRPYLLAVGNLQPRKNLERLVQAFALLKKKMDIPHTLVLTGKNLWREDGVFKAIREMDLQSAVTLTGYVSCEDLAYLYQGADCFVFPSLYEGFGLPVLEAMACGTPVVTSNTSSLPEVAGDAAMFVDPKSIASIVQGIEEVLCSPQLQAKLIEKGLENVKRFSWRKTAEDTLRVYGEVLGNEASG
jgi:glycosyltransferase involved in cell wall biosynthesis